MAPPSLSPPGLASSIRETPPSKREIHERFRPAPTRSGSVGGELTLRQDAPNNQKDRNISCSPWRLIIEGLLQVSIYSRFSTRPRGERFRVKVFVPQLHLRKNSLELTSSWHRTYLVSNYLQVCQFQKSHQCTKTICLRERISFSIQFIPRLRPSFSHGTKILQQYSSNIFLIFFDEKTTKRKFAKFIISWFP